MIRTARTALTDLVGATAAGARHAVRDLSYRRSNRDRQARHTALRETRILELVEEKDREANRARIATDHVLLVRSVMRHLLDAVQVEEGVEEATYDAEDVFAWLPTDELDVDDVTAAAIHHLTHEGWQRSVQAGPTVDGVRSRGIVLRQPITDIPEGEG